MGGGLLLLAFLPNFLPAAAIIPVHGTVQLASNFSRFIFDIKHTCLKPVLLFSLGALLGAYLGSFGISRLDLNLMPLFISVFILALVWLPIKRLMDKVPAKYLSLGVMQCVLSLYVGATGPLSTSVLISDGYQANQVIVSNAAMNSVINAMKLVVFFFIGFSFSEYYLHIFAMMGCAMLGSYLGSRVRKKFDDKVIKIMLKTIITLFCLNNIYRYFI